MQSELSVDTTKLRSIADDLEKTLGGDSQYQGYVKTINSEMAKPVFQLDGAFAYSIAFANNTYSGERFNRSGLWLSATFSDVSFKKDHSDNLSFILLGRALWDNALTDTAKAIFQRKTGYDIGARIDYTISKFSISLEHLNRIYSGNSDLNSNRTVGVIQYKLNNNLYLMGTFGQNFGNVNNVFTLLGINWGFGNSPLTVN